MIQLFLEELRAALILARSGDTVTFHETVLKNSCGDLVTFPLKGSVKNHRGESHYQIWTLDGRADVMKPHRDDIISVGGL
jgi:hypothetical protein